MIDWDTSYPLVERQFLRLFVRQHSRAGLAETTARREVPQLCYQARTAQIGVRARWAASAAHRPRQARGATAKASLATRARRANAGPRGVPGERSTVSRAAMDRGRASTARPCRRGH